MMIKPSLQKENAAHANTICETLPNIAVPITPVMGNFSSKV